MAEKPAETIQTLLQAEEAAKEVIDKARKQRDARLKQAAAEAEAGIKAYRALKETQYQEEVQKHVGSTGDATEKIAADTELRIEEMIVRSKKNRAAVVDKLVEFVTTVDPIVSTQSRGSASASP